MSEDSQKTILLITRNFPPLVGGMEKLNQRMLEGMTRDYTMLLIAPKGAKSFAPPEVEVYEAPTAKLLGFLIHALWIALFIAMRRRPKVCLAGSGLSAPFAWLAARLCGGKAVVYVHGLDLIADSRIYRLLWLPFIRHCDTVIANSTNTRRLAATLGVAQNKISVVNPGTDLPGLNPEKALAFRNQQVLGNVPMLLSVGRITERKGLLPFLQKAWPIILAKHPDAVLVVIGSEPTQALRRDKCGVLAAIHAHLAATGQLQTVRFLGRVDDDTLTVAYQAANVHVFPVLESSDDVEGFGMVAIEAAANGLPTVAFDVGGIADAVEDQVSGRLVPAQDYVKLTNAVLAYIASGRLTEFEEQCRQSARKRSWGEFNTSIQVALLR